MSERRVRVGLLVRVNARDTSSGIDLEGVLTGQVDLKLGILLLLGRILLRLLLLLLRRVRRLTPVLNEVEQIPFRILGVDILAGCREMGGSNRSRTRLAAGV
jgi:hypothetical protein